VKPRLFVLALLTLAGCSNGPDQPSDFCRNTWELRKQLPMLPPPETVKDMEERQLIRGYAAACDRSPGMVVL
jgi:hypothetical protein